MRITSTGHAGAFIETAAGSILCDPWRSPAYFASWFVFPDNSAIDFAALKPDYLYVSHLHRDHFDPRVLGELVSKSARVLLPDYPIDDLRSMLEALGFRHFVETTSGEPLEVDGLRLLITTAVSPADGPLGDSTLSVDDHEVRVLNQNDARPRDLESITAFGPYDGHLLQYSGAIWWPVVYDLPEVARSAFGERKRINGMARAHKFIETIGARFVFPNSGPAAFLDPELFSLNDLDNSADNTFPDQQVFLNYLHDHGQDNGRLLIPGSTATLTAAGCAVSHPMSEAEVAHIFTDKRAYLEAYAERQQPAIEAERRSWPRYSGDLVQALAEWFEPVLALAYRISAGVGGPVLLDVDGELIVIDFPARRVRAWAGEQCRYRFAIARTLLEAQIADHVTDWVNSLFLSMRFQAARKGPYNEFIYTFFKCLTAERMSYAEGWYAEQEGPGEQVRLGDYMVQSRCPHLKADLTQFGTIDDDGILECGMHHWRFDLKTGRCLTSEQHSIVATPLEKASQAEG